MYSVWVVFRHRSYVVCIQSSMFGRLFRSRSIFSFGGLFFSSKLFGASSSKKRLAKEKSTIVPHILDWIHPELPAYIPAGFSSQPSELGTQVYCTRQNWFLRLAFSHLFFDILLHYIRHPYCWFANKTLSVGVNILGFYTVHSVAMVFRHCLALFFWWSSVSNGLDKSIPLACRAFTALMLRKHRCITLITRRSIGFLEIWIVPGKPATQVYCDISCKTS